MSFKILLPFAYLFFGFLLGKTKLEVKGKASYVLTKIVIPLVIIYNIATYRADVFILMAAMIIMMSCMLLISRFITKDTVKRLCFCYLNIGWLALPVASTVWGDGAARLLIAVYTGSSIFGNSVGAGLLVNDDAQRFDIKKTITSPPVAALLIGLACIPLGGFMQSHVQPVYRLLKWLMSFLGMAILGIWLAGIKLHVADIKETVKWIILRAVTVSLFVSAWIFIGGILHLELVTGNKEALFMLSILPPAANIIVLETHYRKTGESAGMIACGTLLSIGLIIVYAAITTWLF